MTGSSSKYTLSPSPLFRLKIDVNHCVGFLCTDSPYRTKYSKLFCSGKEPQQSDACLRRISVTRAARIREESRRVRSSVAPKAADESAKLHRVLVDLANKLFPHVY